MNKRGHIKSCNSSLTQSSWELEKSSLDGLQFYLRADFSAQPTNLAQDTRIANALKKFASCKNAESRLDSANPQNLVKNNLARSANPCKSFCYFLLSQKVESPSSFNHNLPNKVDSQNLVENQAKNAESANKSQQTIEEIAVEVAEFLGDFECKTGLKSAQCSKSPKSPQDAPKTKLQTQDELT